MAVVERVREQRVVLRGVSWGTYEALMADYADRSAPRFTYDRGELEIAVPLPTHEKYKRAVELAVYLAAESLEIEFYSLGSTTFKREDLERGVEPDSCFYTTNLEHMYGRERIDPAVDPSPDLAIEIEYTAPSIAKLPIYAAFGVREVWTYDTRRFAILALVGDRYVPRRESGILPGVRAEDTERLLADSIVMGDLAWGRKVREWARGLAGDGAR